MQMRLALLILTFLLLSEKAVEYSPIGHSGPASLLVRASVFLKVVS